MHDETLDAILILPKLGHTLLAISVCIPIPVCVHGIGTGIFFSGGFVARARRGLFLVPPAASGIVSSLLFPISPIFVLFLVVPFAVGPLLDDFCVAGHRGKLLLCALLLVDAARLDRLVQADLELLLDLPLGAAPHRTPGQHQPPRALGGQLRELVGGDAVETEALTKLVDIIQGPLSLVRPDYAHHPGSRIRFLGQVLAKPKIMINRVQHIFDLVRALSKQNALQSLLPFIAQACALHKIRDSLLQLFGQPCHCDLLQLCEDNRLPVTPIVVGFQHLDHPQGSPRIHAPECSPHFFRGLIPDQELVDLPPRLRGGAPCVRAPGAAGRGTQSVERVGSDRAKFAVNLHGTLPCSHLRSTSILEDHEAEAPTRATFVAAYGRLLDGAAVPESRLQHPVRGGQRQAVDEDFSTRGAPSMPTHGPTDHADALCVTGILSSRGLGCLASSIRRFPSLHCDPIIRVIGWCLLWERGHCCHRCERAWTWNGSQGGLCLVSLLRA
mmetsp:Transcript_91230/g.292962  ORF Transcript_91230/g.292962 Transcript_91230/m.292962 type:complete len:498 (+) Transcript_91230:2600-4093(+)